MATIKLDEVLTLKYLEIINCILFVTIPLQIIFYMNLTTGKDIRYDIAT